MRTNSERQIAATEPTIAECLAGALSARRSPTGAVVWLSPYGHRTLDQGHGWQDYCHRATAEDYASAVAEDSAVVAVLTYEHRACYSASE